MRASAFCFAVPEARRALPLGGLFRGPGGLGARVTAADASVVPESLGSIVRLNVAAAGPFAPEGDSGVASALAASSTSSSAAALPAGVARRLENVDLNSGRTAALFQHFADQNLPGTRKLLAKIETLADELGLEDGR